MSQPTQSEAIFEKFLQEHGLAFKKIEEVYEKAAHRPDYLVELADEVTLVFEVKEIAEDPDFEVVTHSTPYITVSSGSRVLGEHIRRRIQGSKKQIQYGAKQGFPSILLVYNRLDRVFQDFGTHPMDFIAAMYGAPTINIDKVTRRTSEMFNGRDDLLQEEKNTSFSAVGHLCDRGGKTTTVTLYENDSAKIPVPYERLPACFDVKRIERSTEPLRFTGILK